METFIIFIGLAFMEGLLASGIILLSKKWGLIEAYQLYRKSWMPDNCDFCFGFWLSAMILIIYTIVAKEISLINIFTPLAGAVISRKFL